MEKEKGALIWIAAVSFVFVIVIGQSLSFLNMGKKEINFNDFSILKYQAEAARKFHEKSGELWGYDPHFMAGYPLDFTWNSNVAIQWTAVKYKKVPMDHILRILLVFGMAIFPLIFWISAKNFDFDTDAASFSMILGGLYFIIGLPIMFFLTGMITAGIASYFSILTVSFLYRYVKQGGIWLVPAMISAAVALFIHKTTILIVCPSIIVILIHLFKEKKKTHLVGMIAVAISVLILNFFWIKEIFMFRDFIQEAPEAPFWQNFDLIRPIKDYLLGNVEMNNIEFAGVYGILHSFSLCLILLLGITGIVSLMKRKNTLLATLCAVSAITLWVYSYYGAYLPGGGQLNPTRYFATSQLWLAISGGQALFLFRSGKTKVGYYSVALIVAIFCICTMIYGTNRLKPLKLMLETPLPIEVEDLISRIKEMPNEGRIMIEDSGVMDTEGEGQIYGKNQIISNFGLLTGKEFIGGPYPYVFTKYGNTTFKDGRAFGKSLSETIPSEFLEKLRIYDVKWIICWSGASEEYLRKYSGYFSKIEDIQPFSLYEVADYNPTKFLKGDGKVEADYGRITITPDKKGEDVVIKYHWTPEISAFPKVKLYQYRVSGDPVALIGIKGLNKKVTLRIP